MNSFDVKTKIYFGENSLERLKSVGKKRVLVICDPFAVKSGLISHITSKLDAAGADYDVYSDIVPDPPISKIALGVEKMGEFRPELLIAVGGGSAIDSAKAIREVAVSSKKSAYIDLIAIPTTSGTGSEVTSFSVITDPENHKKYPLVSESLLPQEAILDAELVRSVPPSVTADTGMDVFTHALEAYVSTNANEFSDALSEKSMELFGAFMIRSFADNNDIEARRKMHAASCLAGLSFNAVSLGLNHGMAHQLGSMFHIPHGRANALLLPSVIEFNSGISPESREENGISATAQKYAAAAETLGLHAFDAATTVKQLVNFVRFMLAEMKMPRSISEIGKISEKDYFGAIDAMADAALADPCTATNPKKPTKEEVMQIYRELW